MNTMILSIIAIVEGVGLIGLAGAFIWAYRTLSATAALAPAATQEMRTLIGEAEAIGARLAASLTTAGQPAPTAAPAPAVTAPASTAEAMTAATRATVGRGPSKSVPIDPIARTLRAERGAAQA